MDSDLNRDVSSGAASGEHSALEAELRGALRERADAVTPDRLRTPASGTARAAVSPRARQPQRARWAPIAAAACVAVAVAVGAAAIEAQHPSSRATSGSDVDPGFGAGRLWHTAWALVQVRAGGGSTTRIPTSIGAGVTFDPTGRVTATDSVNSLSATCRFAADGTVVIGTATSTAAGYAGSDPARLAAIKGIDAFMAGGTDQADAGARQSVAGDRLTLRVAQYTLVFTRLAPPATSSAPASASATTPVTHSVPSYVNGSEVAPS